MFATYSVAHGRRYRYYVCYKAQQKLDDSCRTKSVSVASVEDAVVESVRRVGVHPEVLAEIASVTRQRLAETLASLREALSTANLRAKNLKSQLARSRKADASRLSELTEQIAEADSRAAELRTEVQRLEKQRIDEKDLRKTMQSFDEVWKAMNIDEQRALLGQLVEKVGYDGRTAKVTVSMKSAGAKELVMKGAA